jgi:hypothetical protein
MRGTEVSDQYQPVDRQKALQLSYERLCASYEGITDFRGKLLTLLPIATGTGAFLLLDRGRKDSEFLGPVGLLGVVVTLGLYMYEFRGVQRCHRMEVQAQALEKELNLDPDKGLFRGQPDRLLGNMIGPPAAGLIVYLAAVFAWLYVAGYGLEWWNNEVRRERAWLLAPAYAITLTGAWAIFWWRLPTWTQAGQESSEPNRDGHRGHAGAAHHRRITDSSHQ